MNLKKEIIGILISVLVVFVFIACNQFEKIPLISTEGQTYEKAVVTKIIKDNLAEDGNRYGNQEVIVKIKSGELKGQELEAINPNGTLFGAECEVGTNVIIMLSITDETAIATVYSQDRSLAIYGFALIFVLVVCVIGGKKGVQAVISLIFTLLCIVFILFPLIYCGISPIFVTVIIAILSTVVTLGLLGGFTGKTLSAMIGTMAGVVIAAIAALLFGEAAGISGYNVSDIETLMYVGQNSSIRIGQLLFSGIIISALGAVMDVGMSISSTIQELHDANPAMTSKDLFVSGIHVGRDMMGTMTNTLIFAYVGGSITTLVTNYAYDLPYLQLLNSYAIGIEVMQGLSGSLGVVLTVPITAAIASVLVNRKKD